MKLAFFHNELIIFLITSILMVYFDLRGQLTEMYTTFWICFAINILTGLRFIYLFIDQITKFLGIYCFSLKKRPIPASKQEWMDRTGHESQAEVNIFAWKKWNDLFIQTLMIFYEISLLFLSFIFILLIRNGIFDKSH